MRCFKVPLAGLIVICTFATTGCAKYLDRKETVALSAGNAVETNLVTHTIDPWPEHARNTRILYSGERLQRAVERYRKNEVTDPSADAAGSGVTVQQPK